MYLLGPYDAALAQILEHGVWRTNQRTKTRTKAVMGIQSRYRLDDPEGRFPILTARKVWPKSIFAELIWFLSGSTNNNDLVNLGANIWTPWVDEEFEKKHDYAPGSFGPIYGFQLRHFGGNYNRGLKVDNFFIGADCHDGFDTHYGEGGFDQLQYMLDRIKADPSCRRIMFSLWNPRDTSSMKLPPCHYSYQLFIDDDGYMSGMLTQRSCDFPIGVPANIQFYSALTIMFAQQTGYKPREFIHSTCDSHIYEPQIAAVEEYLQRPKPRSPILTINKANDMLSYKVDDFVISDYEPEPAIKIPVEV